MTSLPKPSGRGALLRARQQRKMACSPECYVRGSTRQFYDWLDSDKRTRLSDGPEIWICGDCHIGNIGPLADHQGNIAIEIRDLDQAVIGNPAYDLVRLGLSLASSARGSSLPGVATALMLECLIDGYTQAFEPGFDEGDLDMPKAVRRGLKLSKTASWSTLAEDRLMDDRPTIPLGKRFWPLSAKERKAVEKLAAEEDLRQLVTRLRHRDDHAEVELIDAAYWVKGCSSLGLVRLALLMRVNGDDKLRREYCLIDVKEAIKAWAPFADKAKMPRDNAQRVVEGARALSPSLGYRMLATRLFDRPVFIRELLPQDLKLNIDRLSHKQACLTARFLGAVVGHAHARQMAASTRKSWLADLKRRQSKSVDAPSWLWTSVVELLARHERAYLEHCWRYAVG
ncbi:MAG TPA: DUF2252 family protein [Magnetospirillaceae bacterium]|nr:DUF2252 family protein [Magnetospirillaceae bacterium]